MLNEIPHILSQADLDNIASLVEQASWQAGIESAGAQAKGVKTNQEMAQSCESWKAINQLVVSQLYAHPTFQSLVLPSRVSAAFVSRCQPGMHYGQHIDNPIMGAPGTFYRSDIAITVFLNDPESYEGGALTIQSQFGPVAVKLAAGSAVVYPASNVHEVTPVTSGERIVCALWAQSLVREPDKRELLHKLDEARQALHQSTPQAQVTQQIEQVYANLLRMWSDV